MNNTFTYAGGSLQLCRWPLNQPNSSLQAWDAADELLIQHTLEAAAQFTTSHNRQPKILIINDSFGALSCALANLEQVQVNDSLLAEQGTRYNREQNKLPLGQLHQQSSLQAYPNHPDIVLLKLPNNHSYLQFILQQLATVAHSDGIILASAKAKDITRNVLAMFDNTLGPTTASLTVKKCRLIQCQFNAKLKPSAAVNFPLRWPLDDSSNIVVNHANVFSREKLDQGARFFLQHLPLITAGQTVIDLGCGNGVLGLKLLQQCDDIALICCDESYMAVESAKMTIAENLPDKLSQCDFITDDCLSKQGDKTADYILCNPPFHQQHAVTSHIASQMFNDAKRVLKQGGHLRIVANRHLGYADILKRLFGNCRQLAADAKFVILDATKRS
ncbi:methyltransferase [Rheinheimera baltica]|uniref:methyltransferase n=1 Tax=Rheinheimera baltica TaxID=67576 RepID=UPI00273F2365|nr:methyltransferase [Rheinheimera baltica]MDP5144403.1 methyltransferase [Rheinheimera baltica]